MPEARSRPLTLCGSWGVGKASLRSRTLQDPKQGRFALKRWPRWARRARPAILKMLESSDSKFAAADVVAAVLAEPSGATLKKHLDDPERALRPEHDSDLGL